jgi:hypothetical protein
MADTACSKGTKRYKSVIFVILDKIITFANNYLFAKVCKQVG